MGVVRLPGCGLGVAVGNGLRHSEREKDGQEQPRPARRKDDAVCDGLEDGEGF